MLAALGILAASCDDDLVPPTPQQNPQEPIITAGDITTEKAGVLVTEDPSATPSLDLNNYLGDGDAIPVVKNVQALNMNEGASIVYRMELSNTADFAQKYVLNLTPGSTEETADIYYADPTWWDEAQNQLFGNSPKPQTVYYRVPVYINITDTDFRYNSNDYYALEGTIYVSRIKPDYTIEAAYYVFGPFIGGNSPATAVAMEHSDRDEYDDPVFSYFFTVSEDAAATGYTILIAPESVKNANGTNQQCYGAGQKEGELVLAGQPIKVTEAGPYKIEVNMKDYTYAISATPEVLYAPSTGAKFNKKCLPLHTSDFIEYTGLTYLESGFTLTGQKGWAPVAYGQGDGKGAIKRIPNGNSPDDEIKVTGKGSHWVDVNLGKMTVETTFIESLGIVGAYNNWGNAHEDGTVEKDVELTHDKDYIVWKGEFTVATASEEAPSEWKIRANNAWAISFGAPKWEGNVVVENQADYDGANWKITEPGKYEVEFNCGVYPYTVTITKK